MKVLSLFDGMSCGQIALRESGIPVDVYHASEIDKHAIAQTALNFPETIQLGDVTRWREWDIPWGEIDLLIGGSPCQGFSVAGKGLNFKNPRSRLFFTFVEIRDHLLSVNPNARWMLENVDMKQEWIGRISRHLGIYPVKINSALVSAQNRVRLYWTNIRARQDGLFNELHTDIPHPEDRGIVIRDILENDVPEKYFVSEKTLERVLKEKSLNLFFMEISGKSKTLRCSTGRSLDRKHNYQFIIDTDGNLRQNQDKSTCIVAEGNGPGNHPQIDLIVQGERGYNKGSVHTCKSPTIAGNDYPSNNLVIQLNKANETQPHQQNRVYAARGKSPALCAGLSGGICGPSVAISDGIIVRRLTPRECSRLQTVPEWYKWACSDTRAYRLLGNGWTIEVIKHILSFMNTKNDKI